MISLPNPMEVPIVPYEYLFCPPSSDWLWPLAQRRARGLLSRSGILGIARHQLQPKFLDTIGSLLRHTAGEHYTTDQK
jgi:hypothetical protein